MQTLTLARDQSGFLSVPFTPLTPLHPSMTDSNLAALAESVALEEGDDGTLDLSSFANASFSARPEGSPDSSPPRRLLRSISSANSSISRQGVHVSQLSLKLEQTCIERSYTCWLQG